MNPNAITVLGRRSNGSCNGFNPDFAFRGFGHKRFCARTGTRGLFLADLVMHKKIEANHGLAWQFTDKQFTAWGGLRVFEELLRGLGWEEALQGAALPVPGSNRGLHPVLMVKAFLVTVWTGGDRFAHTALVRFDEALRAIFGLAKVASVSTFSRFFRRFGPKETQEVFGHLSSWVWARVAGRNWTVDLDSSVLTRYGQQEGSARGYNPKRQGKRSHHPLMAFAAECRMVITAWLRPVNTTDSSNAQNFLHEVLNVLDKMNAIEKAIVVGIYPNDRMTEYTLPGYYDYGRFLVETLKPLIDVKYRTLEGP